MKSIGVDELAGEEGYSDTERIGIRPTLDVNAIEETFGKKPIPVRSGGSIPIVTVFEQILGIKSILLGFGLDTDAIHSPNENFPLNNFIRGIETIPLFFIHYFKLKS